jgi:hypothetical protein
VLTILIYWTKNKYHKEKQKEEASKEVGLEVKTEKTKCMVMSYHQSSGQIHKLMITNKSLENVAKLNMLVYWAKCKYHK